MASVPQPNNAAARQDLYRRVAKENFAPLWEVYHSLIPNQPLTPCKPAIWKYKQARPHPGERAHQQVAEEAGGPDVHADVVGVELAAPFRPR